MSAREKVLNSYREILVAEGERAATMDQVAARAGVSKGGLLYHFPDKAALAEGLLQEVRELMAQDLDKMRDAPEGPAAYYLRGSLLQDDPLDRSIIAAMRLAPEHNRRKQEVLAEVRQGWLDLLVGEIGDAVIADAIMLMGDGLYYQATLADTLEDAPGEECDQREEVRIAGLGKVLDMLRSAGGPQGDLPEQGV